MSCETAIPIQVYCKLSAPTLADTSIRTAPSERLLYSNDHRHLSLRIPNSWARKFGNQRELLYSFDKIFDKQDGFEPLDADEIAVPLVHNLLSYCNGLIVLNGINEAAEIGTSRRGDQDETFDLFRLVIERLLRTIEPNHHTRLFKPTRSNWFKIRARPVPVPGDIVYSVFVSCVELRRNQVYDLLDDKNPNLVKHLSKDSRDSVFVKEASWVEIESPDDVAAIFESVKFQLEPDSSFQHAASVEHTHSHVVITLKLVEMRLLGDLNFQEGVSVPIRVSELALVDLARQEKTSRRVMPNELNFLSGSQMAMRNCLEIYRENALNPRTKKIVPYKDSKLTLLLKNFFELPAEIKLILCFDKNSTQFEQIFNTLRFAKLASGMGEEQTRLARHDFSYSRAQRAPETNSDDLVRGVCNQNFELSETNEANLHPLEVRSPNHENSVNQIISFMEDMRLNSNGVIYSKERKCFVEKRITNGRDLDSELDLLKNEIDQYEAVNEDNEKPPMLGFDQRPIELSEKAETNQIRVIEIPSSRAVAANQARVLVPSSNHLASSESSSVSSSTAFVSNLSVRILGSPAKFCRKLMNKDSVRSETGNNWLRFEDQGVPVGNWRSQPRRPRSADVWLDHQPRAISKLDTVLQPNLTRKRSVRKLEYKDTKKSSKYLLTHQQQDEYGEIKTNLIKGDILKSPAGGSSVVFTDVEILRLKKPETPKMEPPTGSQKGPEESNSVIEQRCSIGIEGNRRLRI